MADHSTDKTGKLLVIWSSADRDVALSNVFMYTHNAKRKDWWENVRLVVWGPSSRLLAQDRELQEKIAAMKDDGVELQACKACADMYGVSDQLIGFGVDVQYMGIPLTDMLKSGWTCLTY